MWIYLIFVFDIIYQLYIVKFLAFRLRKSKKIIFLNGRKVATGFWIRPLGRIILIAPEKEASKQLIWILNAEFLEFFRCWIKIRLEPELAIRSSSAAAAKKQGCQIFLGQTYQNGGKIYQMANKYTYQLAIKYTYKRPTNIPTKWPLNIPNGH
jgi:hypothetical protein